MTGIHSTEMATSTSTDTLPTMSCSTSISLSDFLAQAFFLTRAQMSTVKIVEEELKIEVKEDIRAAIITASMIPRRPFFLKK